MQYILTGIALVAAALAGCVSAADAGSHGMVVLQQGTHSDFRDRAFKAIRSQAELTALWTLMYAKTSPPALPQIDWSRQMVLAYFMGEQNHGGYVVNITRAAAVQDAFKVEVTITVPGRTCPVTEVLTQPYVIVAVPASAAAVKPDIQQKSGKPCS